MPESTFFQFLPKKNYLNKKVATFENFVKDVVFVYFEIEKVEIFCQILRVASYYFQADPRHCFLTKPRVTAVESVSAPAPTPSFLYLLHTNKVNEYKEEQDAYPTVIDTVIRVGWRI